MPSALVLLLVLLAGTATGADWREGHTIGVPLGTWDASHLGGCGAWSAAPGPPVWAFGHFPASSNAPCPYPGQRNDFGPDSGTWETVDVTAHGVPDDAVAVFLGGVNIVTHQDTAGHCGFRLHVRTPSNPSGWNACQAVATTAGGGQRSGCGVWVALEAGRFEAMWSYDPNPPGASCAMMTVLRVQAYAR